MIKKSTWIIFATMLVFVGIFIFLQQKELLGFMNQEDEPTNTPMSAFITFDLSQVKNIQYIENNKNPIVLSKQTDGSWISSPSGGQISSGNIEQIFSELRAIKTSAVLEIDLSGDISGTDKPTYLFIFNLYDGSQRNLKIGDPNPFGTGYYAQIDLDKVVVIPRGGVDNIVQIISFSIQTPTPIATLQSDEG